MSANRRRGGCGFIVGVFALALNACLDAPDPAETQTFLELRPGEARALTLGEAAGALAGVSIDIGANAVSKPTTIVLSALALTTPVFFQQGMQLRSPAVVIEPAGRLFAQAVSLSVPWFSLGETIPTSQVRGFVSNGPRGIARGLWQRVDVAPQLPRQVRIPVQSGGVYWAANFESNPDRTPNEIFAEPCSGTNATLAPCESATACRPTGCLGEVCGLAPTSTSCRPSSASRARFGCGCRCVFEQCQWVQ